MANPSSEELEALLFGAELADRGFDEYPEWAEEVMQRFPSRELRGRLRSLYSLARELRLHPPGDRRRIASEMIAHHRIVETAADSVRVDVSAATGAEVSGELVFQMDTGAQGREAPRQATTVVTGKRGSLIGLVMSGLVCLVLAAVILAGGAEPWAFLVVLLVGWGFITQFSRFARPPLISIRNGMFSLRLTNVLETPADNVAAVMMSGGKVAILFHDPAQVKPEGIRLHLARQFQAAGVHLVIGSGLFTLDDVNKMRHALGMPTQVLDPSSDGLSDFHRQLAAATPAVFVTPAIVIVNTLVFLAISYAGGTLWGPDGETMFRWGANFAPATTQGEWWRLLTSMFLHWNILHLLVNMWVLWDIGRLVERLVGNAGFALSYLVAGVAGGVASVLWRSDVLSAGASGAVFGVFGLLLGFLFLNRKSIPTEAIRQHRDAAVAFVVFNLIFGLSIKWIDNAAHIGGLAGGFLCGLLLSQEISPDKMYARRLRTALLAVAAIAAWFAVVNMVPERTNVAAELQQEIVALDQRSIEIDGETWEALRRENISPAEAERRLEQEVVAVHERLQQKIDEAISAGESDPKTLKQYAEYVKRRKAGWALMAQAAAANDRGLAMRATQRINEALEVMQDEEEP